MLPESRGAAALRLHWEVADSPLCQEDAGREREEPILSHCAAEEPLTCRIWRGVGRQWHPDEEELKKPVVGGGREGSGAAGEGRAWRGTASGEGAWRGATGGEGAWRGATSGEGAPRGGRRSVVGGERVGASLLGDRGGLW
mgnify:CR=1 FL=1